MQSQQGIIKSVDFNSGLGYIQANNEREIVFVSKGLEGKIDRDLPIYFEIKQTRVGLIAVNIQPLLLRS